MLVNNSDLPTSHQFYLSRGLVQRLNETLGEWKVQSGLLCSGLYGMSDNLYASYPLHWNKLVAWVFAIMNDHDVSKYNSAVRALLSLNFDLRDIHRQNALRELEVETPPTERDLRWAVTTPANWHSHFTALQDDLTKKDGLVEVGGLRELSISTVRAGGQFVLAPAWRTVLRETCGLTPTSTIVVTELSFKKGSKIVDRLKIESTQHIADVKNRKHLLQAYTITKFTDFMEKVQLEIEKNEKAHVAKDEKEPKVKKSKPTTQKLADLLEDYL